MEWKMSEMDGLIETAGDAGMRPIDTDAIRAIATRTVELVAARDGTMTAEQTEYALHVLRGFSGTPGHVDALERHIAAQGARIAVMESAATLKAGGEGFTKALAEMEETEAYDRGAEDMRAACWEAVRLVLRESGLTPKDREWVAVKSALEGAAP